MQKLQAVEKKKTYTNEKMENIKGLIRIDIVSVTRAAEDIIICKGMVVRSYVEPQQPCSIMG